MKNLTSSECTGAHRAVRDTLDIVGGKWKLVILTTLIDKERRFKELAREIGISPRILSKELQDLEINKLVTRTVCDTRPITVEYSITEHGQTLEKVTTALRDWGLTHRKEIIGTQESLTPVTG
ncbi:winged helix-turn-helix transcriptional regulator [Spirosoma flavum]|uniref:Winged helix-turn-helix transcriptional regulator n=1 Tax=Spirosoma flavum TaxID=2048557 RepID=A0ABW6AKG9_9BACT